jgi:hypothetical protein
MIEMKGEWVGETSRERNVIKNEIKGHMEACWMGNKKTWYKMKKEIMAKNKLKGTE